jgi:hypothetical protein
MELYVGGFMTHAGNGNVMASVSRIDGTSGEAIWHTGIN